jgi:predicted MFS family arabinose efflux permease
MGAVMSAFAIASSVGVTISLYLVEVFGNNWHVPFIMVAVLAMIIFTLCYNILPTLNNHLTGRTIILVQKDCKKFIGFFE